MQHISELHQSQRKVFLTINCVFFQQVDSEPPRRGRRSNVLKVAMTFPTKKTGKKRPASEPLPQSKAQDSDSDSEENIIDKRALNIKENKAMVQFAVFVSHSLIL